MIHLLELFFFSFLSFLQSFVKYIIDLFSCIFSSFIPSLVLASSILAQWPTIHGILYGKKQMIRGKKNLGVDISKPISYNIKMMK